MANGKKFWVYPAAAVIVAAVIIAATAAYMGLQSKPTSTPNAYSVLTIQLTDPPQVPTGTMWLNITFTEISLVVSEPSGQGSQVVVKTITITPSGGSATIDLLALQNYTETVAVANLTQDSTVYSVSFAVSKALIDVNGTTSNVTIAGGSNTLQATIANPKPLSGDNQALIELNPIVVSTPTGYQLIPSTVAVVAPAEHVGHEGSVSTLSQQEEQQLEEARGNLSVKVISLEAQGNTTTFTVLVNNTGNVSVQLVAIALHGDFNVTGPACKAGEHGQGENGMGDQGDQGNGNQGMQDNSSDNQDHGSENQGCEHPEHPDEVVFIPINSTMSSSSTSTATATSTTTSTTTATSTSTSSTSTSQARCVSLNMSVVGGQGGDDNSQGDENQQQAGILIRPGQCVELTFKGTISFGNSQLTLVPSLTSGSSYVVHVIASNGAEQKLECTVPVGPASCTPIDNEEGDQEGD